MAGLLGLDTKTESYQHPTPKFPTGAFISSEKKKKGMEIPLFVRIEKAGSQKRKKERVSKGK